MNLTRRHLTLIAVIGVLIALVGVAGLMLDRSASRRRARPRLMRDFTVPIELLMLAAISS